MLNLFDIFFCLQRQLFPVLEAEMGAISLLDRQFCQVVSLINIRPFLKPYEWVGNGCPPHARMWLVHAFVAKSVYQFPTTGALIEALKGRPTLRRLCGWESAGDIPSESTFSRAFAAFAADELPQRIHEEMILMHARDKVVGHVSRDATAIPAPERPEPKAAQVVRPRLKPGPKARGEVREPVPPKRLQLQMGRSLEENLADLPKCCNTGTKKNSHGYKESWDGYKLHLDTIDGDIPVSALLTSASLHDSQAAIPLMQMTARRVTSLYDVMDSAYDADLIWNFSRQLGHIPIIEMMPQRKHLPPMDPATEQRFKQRTSVERVNSLLKQRYGARWVRVRGAHKVMAHLMFGIIALTASALFARLC